MDIPFSFAFQMLNAWHSLQSNKLNVAMYEKFWKIIVPCSSGSMTIPKWRKNLRASISCHVGFSSPKKKKKHICWVLFLFINLHQLIFHYKYCGTLGAIKLGLLQQIIGIYQQTNRNGNGNSLKISNIHEKGKKNLWFVMCFVMEYMSHSFTTFKKKKIRTSLFITPL